MSNQVITPAKSSVRDVILSDSMKKQFQNALPKVLPVDRFIRCLVTQFSRIPQLADCDKASVLSAAMTAAQLGLEIDPALGRAYMLPYRDKKKGMIAQLIVGYKGYTDLAYRSGQVSGIQCEAVYEKDLFEYEYGLNPKLKHIPFEGEDRGPLKYSWIVVSLKNGGNVWKVLNRAEVMRHKGYSKGADSEYSPWNTSEATMWQKTAMRVIAAWIPQSPELRDAVAVEDTDAIVSPVSLGDALDVSSPSEISADASGLAAAASVQAESVDEDISKTIILKMKENAAKKGIADKKEVDMIIDAYCADDVGKDFNDLTAEEYKALLAKIVKQQGDKKLAQEQKK